MEGDVEAAAQAFQNGMYNEALRLTRQVEKDSAQVRLASLIGLGRFQSALRLSRQFCPPEHDYDPRFSPLWVQLLFGLGQDARLVQMAGGWTEATCCYYTALSAARLLDWNLFRQKLCEWRTLDNSELRPWREAELRFLLDEPMPDPLGNVLALRTVQDAQLRFCVEAVEAVESSDFERARVLLNQAEAHGEAGPVVHCVRGFLLTREGRPADAFGEFEEALREWPSHRYSLRMASHYLAHHNAAQAETYTERLLQIAPFHRDSYPPAGLLALRKGRLRAFVALVRRRAVTSDFRDRAKVLVEADEKGAKRSACAGRDEIEG